MASLQELTDQWKRTESGMSMADLLVLRQTLRAGNCNHTSRVNICADCLLKLEKLVEFQMTLLVQEKKE